MRKTSDVRSATCPGVTGAVLAIVTMMALAGCAPSGAPSLRETGDPSRSAPPDEPVGLIVLGHSALTGEGTAPSATEALENSWASGTNPTVQSVYLRMLATLPEMEDSSPTKPSVGHGRTLAVQAQEALEASAPRSCDHPDHRQRHPLRHRRNPRERAWRFRVGGVADDLGTISRNQDLPRFPGRSTTPSRADALRGRNELAGFGRPVRLLRRGRRCGA